MSIGKRARLLHVAALVLVGSLVTVLTGCKGFFDTPPATGTSTTTSTTTLSSGNFYVLNQKTNQVVALSIASGKLNTIGTATLSSQPLAMAVAPNGQFLYVSTISGIYLYTIASNGDLTLGNSSNAISSDPAATMQVDATNGWLVDAVTSTNELFAIAINPGTGLLATSGETEQPLPNGLTATTPIQLAISPNDSSSCSDCYVFVAMGSGGTEAIHFFPSSANPFGSALSIHLANSAGGANAVAVDPSNRLLYVGESAALPADAQPGGLRAFTIAANGMTEISGSPITSGGTGPSSILPQTDYVYVANEAVSNSATGNIASFSLTASGSTYALASLATVAAGTTPQGLAAESSGNFMLVVDSGGSPDLDAYTISAGTLTSALTAPTGTDPVGAIAIAAEP